MTTIKGIITIITNQRKNFRRRFRLSTLNLTTNLSILHYHSRVIVKKDLLLILMRSRNVYTKLQNTSCDKNNLNNLFEVLVI